MSKKSEALPEKGNKRRDFLKIAAISAPAAAVAVGTIGVEDAAAAIDSDGDKLRDTAHTRAYYDSARF